MDNNIEQLLKLEKHFKEEMEIEKKLLESKIQLLEAKLEFEKSKANIRSSSCNADEIRELKAIYDVKNTRDIEEIKKYYQNEIESTKNWYEEEIKRRIKETEAWHINHLEEEMNKLKQSYNNLLIEKDNKIKELEEEIEKEKEIYRKKEEDLGIHIINQQKYYEEQLRPFKKVISLKEKINKKLKSVKTNKVVKQKETIKENTDTINEETTNTPKVSIILPVYNVGKYLRQSLDSLINQTLQEIEIICVNDGSTDDCYDILEEYKAKDSRIKVIHKENKGTGAARNDGLRLASGECIGFVDPDDWVKPNMFERLYGLIKEKKLDIAMCMPDGYDEKNDINTPFPYFVDSNWEHVIDDRIFNWRDLSPFNYPMCVWNKLYTKKLFDENNIDFAEGLDFEDHKVIFGSLLSAEKIFFIREKLYVYRFNREGSVLTDNNRRLIDHIEIFNIVENLMKETNTFNILREDFLTYKIHNLLYYYSMIKDEFKSEYYENMVKSLKDTNLTEEEYQILCNKYPELVNIKI